MLNKLLATTERLNFSNFTNKTLCVGTSKFTQYTVKNILAS